MSTARTYPQLEGRAQPAVAEAIRRAFDLIYALADQVATWTGTTVGGTTGAASSQVSYVTLSADTEIPSPATPVEGALLTVKVIEDATGGWQITWASDYEASTPVDIDVRADKKTIFHFVGLNDGGALKWSMVSYRTGI